VRGVGKMSRAIASTTFAEGLITQGRRKGRETNREEGREGESAPENERARERRERGVPDTGTLGSATGLSDTCFSCRG
jgi:hypothetical protein